MKTLILSLLLASVALAGYSPRFDQSNVAITGGTINGATVGVTTPAAASFTNVRETQSTLTYAASTALDFTGDGFKTCTLAGNITFTTSNLAAGRSVTIRIVGDSSLRTLTFPAWKFMGSAAPASLAANKTAVLTITSFSTTDASCVAAYVVEP